MDSEETYRVEHIFRPLTADQVKECHQKLIHMEEQFLKAVEKYKKAETPQKQRSQLNIEFEEESLDQKSTLNLENSDLF